jgi:hypothetical protein
MNKFLIFISGVMVIAVSRYIPHFPNFTAASAVGIYAAYLFRDRMLAMTAVLGGMIFSDLLFAGTYEVRQMILVYAGLMLPALLGFTMKPVFGSASDKMTNLLRWTGVVTTGSVFFFLISNFAVWCFGGMYAHDLRGIITCYAMAVPFFASSYAGDICFVILFGSIHYFVTSHLVLNRVGKMGIPVIKSL